MKRWRRKERNARRWTGNKGFLRWPLQNNVRRRAGISRRLRIRHERNTRSRICRSEFAPHWARRAPPPHARNDAESQDYGYRAATSRGDGVDPEQLGMDARNGDSTGRERIGDKSRDGAGSEVDHGGGCPESPGSWQPVSESGSASTQASEPIASRSRPAAVKEVAPERGGRDGGCWWRCRSKSAGSRFGQHDEPRGRGILVCPGSCVRSIGRGPSASLGMTVCGGG